MSRGGWRARVALAAAALVSVGCSSSGDASSPGALPPDAGAVVAAVTTTALLADIVGEVGGARVDVSSVVPATADPHSYQPSPADVVPVLDADVAFTNGLLLEDRSVTRLIEANAPAGVPLIAVAEEAARFGATLLPLDESVNSDVLWLGLAVDIDPEASGVADVRFEVSEVQGPGDLSIYVTSTFGEPRVMASTADGLDGADGFALPAGAHTHVNWAFSEAGAWRVTLAARAGPDPGGDLLAEGTFEFVVESPSPPGGLTAIETGHADVAVTDDDGWALGVRADDGTFLPAEQVALVVPQAARSEVADDARFAFLGPPGASVWLLPQVVLGVHVHGALDPHVWQDVAGAMAYARVVAEVLSEVDPAGAPVYAANLARYLTELTELDAHVRERVSRIPEAARQLVTAHDAFGYLAAAYEVPVLGFVVPVPGQEPSAAQVAALEAAVVDAGVPAVFVEPGYGTRSGVLQRVAAEHGIAVCTLYSDAFDDEVATYTAMVRRNADELARCLGGGR